MERETQYYIAQGEQVQGPFPVSRVLAWIESGKVRPEMLFSREGGAWRAGHECPELFPVARSGRARRSPARRAGRGRAPSDEPGPGRRSRRSVRRAAPGSVLTVVVLDFIAVVLYALLGFLMLGVGAVAAARHSGSEGLAQWFQIFGVVMLVFAGAYVALAVFLIKGSSVARVLQIALSALSLVASLVQIVRIGTVEMMGMFGLALNALIIVLLLTPTAAAFFTGADPARSSRRGGGGRPARRRAR